MADAMILHVDSPKGGTRKLLELINELGNVAGYKVNIQKPVASLYTNNERSEREIQETFLLTITSKRKKYLGINLPKEIKSLYSKNYKMVMKEIKVTNGWKDISSSWSVRINTVKMTKLPKTIYRLNVISIKLPVTFFRELGEKISEFVKGHKRPQTAKSVLKKNNKAGGIRLPGFTLYYTTKLQSSK